MLIQSTQTIDVIDDILKRPDALDSYLGEEVKNYLSQKIVGISESTLFKINLRKANPIDYLFAKSAFGEFFTVISESEIFDCIFFLNKSQTKHLYWGLLASIDGNIHRSGNYEEDFVLKNNIKVCQTNEELLFISALSKHESEILTFINDKKITEEDTVYKEFSNEISHAMISAAMTGLKSKKFIYSDETMIPNKIYSIISKI